MDRFLSLLEKLQQKVIDEENLKLFASKVYIGLFFIDRIKLQISQP